MGDTGSGKVASNRIPLEKVTAAILYPREYHQNRPCPSDRNVLCAPLLVQVAETRTMALSDGKHNNDRIEVHNSIHFVG